MNVWELREAIESAIPVWIYIPIVGLSIAFLAWAWWHQRGKRR